MGIYLVLSAGVLIVLPILALVVIGLNTKTCPKCHYPLHKCDCPPDCDHGETWPIRWTEDGWVAVCKICGTWLYYGDDHDAGPKAAHVEAGPAKQRRAFPGM